MVLGYSVVVGVEMREAKFQDRVVKLHRFISTRMRTCRGELSVRLLQIPVEIEKERPIIFSDLRRPRRAELIKLEKGFILMSSMNDREGEIRPNSQVERHGSDESCGVKIVLLDFLQPLLSPPPLRKHTLQ